MGMKVGLMIRSHKLNTHSRLGTVIDYRNWHLGLGRRFRSLKLWFVLRGFGVTGVQDYIRRASLLQL